MVFKIKYTKFKDKRGYFYEIYNKKYQFSKSLTNFVQSNTHFQKNVLRGLHFQYKNSQSQLVSIISGKIYDVVVDLRIRSKTFMKYDHLLYQKIVIHKSLCHLVSLTDL